MAIKTEPFGRTPAGALVTRYTLQNKHGLRACLMDFGANLLSLETPDRDGSFADIVLGYAKFDEYLHDPCYFGATIGRVANRIRDGRFALDGAEYRLATNDRGRHHLHGGPGGFSARLWQATPLETPDATGLRFTLQSADGDENYPGNLSSRVTYTLDDQNQLIITFEAETDRPTPVNLTHHSYFNLAGQGNGTVHDHRLRIAAEHYAEADVTENLPTGAILPVAGTPLDFRELHPVGPAIEALPGGIDHNFVLAARRPEPAFAALLVEPRSGRQVEVLATQPGLQIYTSNTLPEGTPGKGGHRYGQYSGICLETQHFPDSPNHAHFPSIVLRPGEPYRHVAIYRFGVAK